MKNAFFECLKKSTVTGKLLSQSKFFSMTEKSIWQAIFTQRNSPGRAQRSRTYTAPGLCGLHFEFVSLQSYASPLSTLLSSIYLRHAKTPPISFNKKKEKRRRKTSKNVACGTQAFGWTHLDLFGCGWHGENLRGRLYLHRRKQNAAGYSKAATWPPHANAGGSEAGVAVAQPHIHCKAPHP